MLFSTEDQVSGFFHQLHISEVFLEFFQGLELRRTQASTTARLGWSQALDKGKAPGNSVHGVAARSNLDNSCGLSTGSVSLSCNCSL